MELRAEGVTVPVFKAIKLEMRAYPVKPAHETSDCGDPAAAGSLSKASLVPDLNINNFARFQRLAEANPQERI